MNFICPNVYETDIKRINDEHWFYFSFFTLIFKVLIFYIKKTKRQTCMHVYWASLCLFSIKQAKVFLQRPQR